MTLYSETFVDSDNTIDNNGINIDADWYNVTEAIYQDLTLKLHNCVGQCKIMKESKILS